MKDDILAHVSVKKPAFPCDHEPGIYECGQNTQIITADTQLHITKKGTSDLEIWAPFLFRSCMDPNIMEIRTLSLLIFDDKLELATPYAHASWNRKDIEIQILPWAPAPQQKGCIPCRNCGNCGW